MIICWVCARRFFQFPVMFTNNKKWRSTQRLVRLNQNMTLHLKKHSSLPSMVQWKHLTPECSINLCLQTFPKLLLLFLAPKVTSSLYPECIANLKLPVDAFYRESRSGVNVAKRNITTGLFGLGWNWNSRRKPPATDKLYHIMMYWVRIKWSSLSVTYCWSVVFSRYTGLLHH